MRIPELLLALVLAIAALLGVRLPYGVHGGVIAMFVSLGLFLGISLASRPPILAPDIEAALDV